MGKRSRPNSAKNHNGRRLGFFWAAFFLLAVTFVLYYNSLDNDLLFDDVTLILQNPQVVNLDWHGILFESGYRPLRTLTYALNYWWGGEKPFGYHFVNVLLHLLNVVLVLALLRDLFGKLGAASLAGALIFAVHPVQTAAVAYVSGRKDLLATSFILLSILCFLQYRRGRERGWLWAVLSGSAFFLAVMSKEVAIVLPALLLLVEGFLDRESSGAVGERFPAPFLNAVWTSLRKRFLLYGVFALMAAGALVYALFLVKASRMESYWGGSLGANLGTGFKLFVHYLRMVVYPSPLLADYLGKVFPVSTGLLEPTTILAALLFAGYILLSVWLFARLPAVALGLLWFLVTIVPVLQLIPFHELAADHFLYVPLVGIAIVVAGLVERLRRMIPGFVIGLALVLLTVTCGWAVVRRNQDWQNKEALWESTYRNAPDSYRANANLGQIYFSQGRIEDGIRLTRRATELDPSNALPYGNLGAMYYTVAQRDRNAGRINEALSMQASAQEYLEKALQLEPANPFTLSNLGNTYKELALIYDSQGRPGDALRAREKAEEIYLKAMSSPDLRLDVKRIWFNLGLLKIDGGRYEEAVDYLRRYLSVFPSDGNAGYWMGVALFNLGHYDRAIQKFWAALTVKDRAEVRQKLAEAYDKAGRIQESLKMWRELAKLYPTADNYRGLGTLLLRVGDTVGAKQAFEAANRLDRNPSVLPRVGAHVQG